MEDAQVIEFSPKINEEQLKKDLDKAEKLVEKFLGKKLAKDLKDTIETALRIDSGFLKSLESKRKASTVKKLIEDTKKKNADYFRAEELKVKTRNKIGYDAKTKVFKNKGEVSSEISRLQGMKDSTIDYDAGIIEESIKKLEERQKKFEDAEDEVKKILSENFTEREKINEELKKEIKNLDNLKARYTELSTKDNLTPEEEKEKGSLPDQIKAQDTKVRSVQSNLDKLTNTKKLTKFGKFWNRFNSYLNVRLLRNFFSAIEKGFSESLKSISQVDDGINQSMSQITSSFSIISSSIVSMIGPVLETLTPMIQQISTAIANVANGFNQASAKAKGLSTYTKINTEYMKDFASEANSATLSFDKFESLSGGDSLEGMYEKGDVSEDLSGDASEFGVQMYDALNTILEVVKQIWEIVSPLIGDIVGLINPILTIVNLLLTLLKPAISSIFDIVGGVIDYFAGLLDFVVGILYLLTGDFDKAWEHIGSGFKKMAQGMINQFIGLVNLIIDAINLLVIKLNPMTWLLDLVGVDTSKIQIPHIPLVTLYKNGGIAERGDLFVANEAGPELVYSGPNNSSSIMNISQFRQAVVEGLYEWWSDAKYDIPEPVYGGIDGASIASSKSFISEFNRRNAGMQIK